jgi:hypothetical protein
MKYLSRVFVVAVAALSTPVAVSASTLEVLDTSSMSLTVSTLPPLTVPSNPASIVVSSGAGTFTEPAGVFGPASTQLPRTLFTGVSLISGLTISGFGNGTQVCDGTAPALNCVGGLSGGALVNVLQLFNLTIPLSVVGSPGASVQVDAGGIIITVVGQNWTAGQAAVTGVTVDTPGGGETIGTVFQTGADDRTAGHGGQLVLVSGFRAITNVAGTLPGFVTQTLNFAPEPGRLLAFAAAASALGFLVHARRSKK